MPQVERDFPIGHPAAVDTTIGSPAHLNWIKQHQFEENTRDFPPGHPKAIDTPGNLNHMVWAAGVDPLNPHLEAHTGRPPAQAAAVREWNAAQAAGAHESPVLPVLDYRVAEAALAARRAELKVESLTAEEHMAVIAELQKQGKTRAPDPPPPPPPVRVNPRMTMAEATVALNGAPMPEDWFPSTSKPWFGPSQ